jgi:Fe2+ or Zn2+ uptake regulation protein
MRSVEETACLEDLRRAGLPGRQTLVRLLTRLRGAPDTHLDLADIVQIAAETGLAAIPSEIARQMQMLADHGLVGRLPTSGAGQVFDTVPEPHAHLMYEDTNRYVDLQVSPETLLSIIRHFLAEQPDEVDVVVRFRAPQRSSGRNG